VERRRAQLEESVARYLSQLETADRQEPTEALAERVTRLKKLNKVKEAALLDQRLSKNCSLKSQRTTGPDRRITRWEHEHLLEAVQQRLGANPLAMRQCREIVEHPFGTIHIS
jgi:hypothetical protein